MSTHGLFRPEVFASRRSRLYGDVLLTVPVPVSATALAAVAAAVLLAVLMGLMSHGRSFHGVARILPSGDGAAVTAAKAGVLRGIHVAEGALVEREQAVASVAVAGGERFLPVVAPSAGVLVEARDELLGQLVVPGQALGRILPSDGAGLEAGLVVPSGFRARVGTGRRVSLHFDCAPGADRECFTAVGRVAGFPAEPMWRERAPEVTDGTVFVAVALEDGAAGARPGAVPGVLRTVRVDVEERSLWGWLLGV